MKAVVSSALSFFRIENYQYQTPSPSLRPTFLHTFFRYCEFPLKPTSDSSESRWGEKSLVFRHIGRHLKHSPLSLSFSCVLMILMGKVSLVPLASVCSISGFEVWSQRLISRSLSRFTSIRSHAGEARGENKAVSVSERGACASDQVTSQLVTDVTAVCHGSPSDQAPWQRDTKSVGKFPLSHSAILLITSSQTHHFLLVLRFVFTERKARMTIWTLYLMSADVIMKSYFLLCALFHATL